MSIAIDRPTDSRAMSAAMRRCWSADGEPEINAASINLDDGGYVQWTMAGKPGSPLHVEINEGGYKKPMPEHLVLVLGELGWERPNKKWRFRNWWIQADPADRHRFEAVADLVLESMKLIDERHRFRRLPLRPRPPVMDTPDPGGLTLSADGSELTAHGRTVRETADGGLVIKGHDHSHLVRGWWNDGITDFYFTRGLAQQAVDKLRRAADFGDRPLLPAIQQRFIHTDDLEYFLDAHRIESAYADRYRGVM